MRSRVRPPTAVEGVLELVAAGLTVATAISALRGSAAATSSATRPERRLRRPDTSTKEVSSQQQGRPPTAIECALAVVAAGLAVATAMLALLGSAAAASSTTLIEEGLYAAEPAMTVSYPRATPTESVTESPSPTAAPTVTPTAVLSSPRPSPTPAPATPDPQQFMSMPVEGTWRVICGYRCGLHDKDHMSTFAIDISLEEGETAGQPVRSPVTGRIITVEDSSTYICGGKTTEGIEAGSVIVIDFEATSGSTKRLRLAHIDPASVPDKLRPDGRPVPVNAGTRLGSVANLNPCSHLHISVNRLDDRTEVPEPLTIEGTLLEDCEGKDCWLDALLPGEDR